MLRVNSPSVGDKLRTVIFTDAKAIFTAVKSEQRREVYSIRGIEVYSCLSPDWSVGNKRVEVISRLPGSHSFEALKSILFPMKVNQAPKASDTRNAALVSETKPLAIEFRATPVSKLRMAIPTGMTTVKQIRILVRNSPTFQTQTCSLLGASLRHKIHSYYYYVEIIINYPGKPQQSVNSIAKQYEVSKGDWLGAD